MCLVLVGEAVRSEERCVVKNSASGGARWVDVAPERFPGWVASFARRHGTGGEDQSLTVAMTGGTAGAPPPSPPLADNSKKRAAAEPGDATEPGESPAPGEVPEPGEAGDEA